MIRLIDRLLATPDERANALMRVRTAQIEYGPAARAHLEQKLADPRRRRTRRELRLAIAMTA